MMYRQGDILLIPVPFTDEVARLREDVTDIKSEVKELRKDLSSVEVITANSWADIARLKAK